MSAQRAVGILFGVLFVSMFLQQQVYSALSIPFKTADFALGYGLNFLVAATILVVLWRLPERYEASLGFSFMVGSAVKFLMYFLVYLPYTKANQGLTKPAFFIFFMPYFLALVVETSALIIRQNQKN
jgi:F0F1-type ATP synthase assembly protein I